MIRQIENRIKFWRQSLQAFFSSQRKLRKIKQQILSTLLTIAIVSACGDAAVEHNETQISEISPTPCRVVQHVMGKTCVPNQPKRLVTIAPLSLLSNALALDIQPIGSSIFSFGDLDAAYLSNTTYLGNRTEGIKHLGHADTPNLEQILLLKPDLILAWEPAKGIYPLLSQVAPTVVVPFDMPNWKEPKWQESFHFVATVLGKEEEAEQALRHYKQRIEELKVALGNDYQDKTISVVTGAMYVLAKNSFVGSILNDLELRRPSEQDIDAPNPDGVIINISEERLEILDGDVLFFISHWDGHEEVFERLQKKPLWENLKATQNEQVYFINDAEVWRRGSDPLAANAVIDDLYKYLVNVP
jgi:iron complex transport system substrate-binding protein